jgi:hypothetical protein
VGVMKLGRTLALREGVVGSRAGDDFPSADMRRRLFKGDGIVSWTIGLSFDGEGRAKVVMRRLRFCWLVAGTKSACLPRIPIGTK